jgi:hypothetical protein
MSPTLYPKCSEQTFRFFIIPNLTLALYSFISVLILSTLEATIPTVNLDENGDRIIIARKRDEGARIYEKDPGVNGPNGPVRPPIVHVIQPACIEDQDPENCRVTFAEVPANSILDGDSSSSSSSEDNSDVMNISWKDIVKEYVKRYDEVFCLTSAKAHLDICDLVVDGAKDKWR